MTDLSRCPFCGSDRVELGSVRDGRKVRCLKCGACAGPRFHGPDGWEGADKRAIEAWNSRDGKVESHTLQPREEETTELFRFEDPISGGVTRLENWPEGLVLWNDGRIVWKSFSR